MEVDKQGRINLENANDLGLAQMLLEPNLDVRAKLPINPEFPHATSRFVSKALVRALYDNYGQDQKVFDIREGWQSAELDVIDLISDPA